MQTELISKITNEQKDQALYLVNKIKKSCEMQIKKWVGFIVKSLAECLT